MLGSGVVLICFHGWGASCCRCLVLKAPVDARAPGFVIVNLAAWGIISITTAISWIFGLGVCLV